LQSFSVGAIVLLPFAVRAGPVIWTSAHRDAIEGKFQYQVAWLHMLADRWTVTEKLATMLLWCGDVKKSKAPVMQPMQNLDRLLAVKIRGNDEESCFRGIATRPERVFTHTAALHTTAV
jgi:hypothetical protein